jgi:hypothetical protein
LGVDLASNQIVSPLESIFWLKVLNFWASPTVDPSLEGSGGSIEGRLIQGDE